MDTHTIRIVPPLVITSDQVDWALEVIEDILRHDCRDRMLRS
jgi:ornithine--oxo-acid transaminase